MRVFFSSHLQIDSENVRQAQVAQWEAERLSSLRAVEEANAKLAQQQSQHEEVMALQVDALVARRLQEESSRRLAAERLEQEERCACGECQWICT